MITYSSQGAREYAALGVPPSRIFIAPNAAAPKPIQPLPERPLRYRGEKPAVVFVGRLQERKRVDLLIRACAALPAETQPLLWVIGDGPNRQGLEKLAAAVYPLTTFFGALHGKDLARRLEMADLFVLPGTGGLAVQQAMSHGLPVIVGEADGTQSDLVRETNGWLLSEQNPAALAGLIAAALRDVPALREKGAESYRIVHEEINLEAMVSVFIDTIHEVWHE
jgi:glycosyltransferase involved in cell wall biosynthesis